MRIVLCALLLAGTSWAGDPDPDGDGFLEEDDCPLEPEDRDGFQDDDGCPDPDNDDDGLLDVDDKCPNDPEDKDGFQDEDGCPDVDNDGDRVLDVNDKCPNEPEDYDGDQDADGCPDSSKRVMITSDKIVITGGGRSADAPAAAPAPARRAASPATPIAAASGGKKPLQIAAPAAGRLTAGEWRDLDHWQFWSDLRRRQSALTPDRALKRFGLSADHLISVTLNRGKNTPAVDVPLTLIDGQGTPIARARSDAFGRAHLVFGTARAPLVLKVAGQRHTVAPGQQLEYRVKAKAPAPNLDVMLVVDVTGSMCDELSWLQRELVDVLERSLEAAPNLRLRTAVSAYRDRGDDFVVHPAPFRKTPAEAAQDLTAVSCGGGGDTPEAVDEALANAISEHRWSDRATARLLFLVLDAPPHQRADVTERLRKSIDAAQQKGVRVIAVAGSGIDKTAEFFLRGLSALTGGTYVFLTDHSGIGNPHIKPTVGPHAIEALNDLLVRLIREAAGIRSSAPEHAADQ